MTPFKDIPLGKSSAEVESSIYPELLTYGFLDPWDVKRTVVDSPYFLFLGNKGSGKSAIGEHFRLSSANFYNLFVTNIFLSDFPYGNFEKIVTGDSAPESRFPSAWSWVLLLLLIDSFSKDEGSFSALDEKFQEAIDALRDSGLLPTRSVQETVVSLSKPKFRAKLPAALDIELDLNSKKPSELQLLHAVSQLRKFACTFRGDNKHIIVIDGLDDILLQKEIQYQAIAALVLEAARLNSLLSSEGVPAKVILLCRTDLYERLPGPNKNKIRQDLCIELDWYHNPLEPHESMLVQLVNKRAKHADPTIEEFFSEYFSSIEFDKNKLGEDLLPYLLENTRHTPRDFIQLLVNIQHCCRNAQSKVELEQVLVGITRYSNKYFLPEIKDELVGYTSREIAEATLRAIAKIGKGFLSFKELSAAFKAEGIFKRGDLMSALDPLFRCSAVGIATNENDRIKVAYRYKNHNLMLRTDKMLAVHRGLWKALNIE